MYTVSVPGELLLLKKHFLLNNLEFHMEHSTLFLLLLLLFYLFLSEGLRGDVLTCKNTH